MTLHDCKVAPLTLQTLALANFSLSTGTFSRSNQFYVGSSASNSTESLWDQSIRFWRPVSALKTAFEIISSNRMHFSLNFDGECPRSKLNGKAVKQTAKMNHFQRLNEVKELKFFFFAQRVNTRKQASSRRPLPCDALAPKQSRTAQASGARMTRQRAEDQQLYNRTSLTSRAHRGSLSKQRELVLSSLPPPLAPFFFLGGGRALGSS